MIPVLHGRAVSDVDCGLYPARSMAFHCIELFVMFVITSYCLDMIYYVKRDIKHQIIIVFVHYVPTRYVLGQK